MLERDRLVDIILPLAIADVYTYRVPEAIPYPQIGVRVLVPLGKKSITGIVYRKHEGELPEHVKVRDVIQVLDSHPIVTAQQIQLWEWLSSYYMCTLGEVLSAALPAGIIDDDYTALTTHYIYLHPSLRDEIQLREVLQHLHRAKTQEKLLQCFLNMSSGLDAAVERRCLLEESGVSGAILRCLVDKQILCEEERKKSRLNQYVGSICAPHALDEQQTNAIAAIHRSWKSKTVTLLHGVTSSGKTEVYIHLIEEALQKGQQVLYLVPEIALTTQLTDRLRSVFGNQVVVYHSRFSSAERVEIYQAIRREAEGKVILGARSAIFLPFNNLGLIIVDEEHEPSYKQQDPAPRYHARSAAIMMAQWYGANVLLGTATPSIETYHNAMTGKYGYASMTERYKGLEMPRISMIDLQRQYHRKEMYGHFSDPLVFRIREEIARGKQVILFQNRRGYAPYLQCPNCGEVPRCGNCDVSMTYHKATNMLACHCCGSVVQSLNVCKKCGTAYRTHGFGTERLEEEIKELFPLARTARLDLDSTRKKDSYQDIIDRFAAHEVDILIGTQMVTKGLHFDDVSLVAVLQADSLLNQPDFRSYEHAFHMLEQVSGRAGRTGQQGEVIIQTFDPKNPVFKYLQAHDYQRFYQQQMEERKLFAYPPYFRIISLTLRHRELVRLEAASRLLQERLTQSFGTRVSGIIVPAVARTHNQHIRQIRLRIESSANISRAKTLLQQNINYVQQHVSCKGINIVPDVDV